MKNNLRLISMFNISKLTLLILTFSFLNSYTDEIFLQPISTKKTQTKLKPKIKYNEIVLKPKKVIKIKPKILLPKPKPAKVIKSQSTPLPTKQSIPDLSLSDTTEPIEPQPITPVVPIQTTPIAVQTPEPTQPVTPVQPVPTPVKPIIQDTPIAIKTPVPSQPVTTPVQPVTPIQPVTTPVKPTPTQPAAKLPQPSTTFANANYQAAIGIFNRTDADTITITYIGLSSGSMYYDMTNSNACIISDTACQQNSDCIAGYCQANKQCSHTLPPQYQLNVWKGGYSCGTNDKYISGIIQYQINGQNYNTKGFTVNNQDKISITFNNDGVQIFAKNSTTGILYPAMCSNVDPTINSYSCSCLQYPNASISTGNSCTYDWDFNDPTQIMVPKPMIKSRI